MKKLTWWIVGVVSVAGVVGGSLAIVQTSQGDAVDNGVPEASFPVTAAPEAGGTALSPRPDTASPTPDASLSDFPHQKLTVTDEVPPGSDFAEFRQELQTAIANRDTEFVSRLFPADGMEYGFGGPMTPESAELADPDSWFWPMLEKVMAPNSCEPADYPSTTSNSTVWICPNISPTFMRQYPAPEEAEGIEYEFSNAVVMGQAINVRAEPSTESEVVGVLTDEVVRVNQAAWEGLIAQNSEDVQHPLTGWTPVILPNDVEGYVYNQFVYQPLDPRALFEEVNGEWQIIRILAGD